jgi:hypothetical protein
MVQKSMQMRGLAKENSLPHFLKEPTGAAVRGVAVAFPY